MRRIEWVKTQKKDQKDGLRGEEGRNIRCDIAGGKRNLLIKTISGKMTMVLISKIKYRPDLDMGGYILPIESKKVSPSFVIYSQRDGNLVKSLFKEGYNVKKTKGKLEINRRHWEV